MKLDGPSSNRRPTNMSVCFSFTAPMITEAQERAELQVLSPEEKEAIRKDLFGTGQDLQQEETPEMISNGLSIMRSAIGEMPHIMKKDYMQALDQVPHLVERQSNWEAFLRAADYDAWEAARRLVSSWAIRKKTFGTKAFLLPMTLSCAMFEEKDSFAHCFIRRLPNDNQGRGVVFFDRIKCSSLGLKRQDILRSIYYMLWTLQESEQIQKHGIVLIVNLKNLDLYKHFDRVVMKEFLGMLRDGPVHWRCTHLCFGSRKSVVGLLLPVFKQLAGSYYRPRIVLQVGNDVEIVAGLKKYGISENNLSKVVGGRLGNEDFPEWLDSRRRLEASMH